MTRSSATPGLGRCSSSPTERVGAMARGATTGSSAGVWLKIAKKGSGVTTVTYAEALEEALCYGWIDGQKAPVRRDLLASALHAPRPAQQVVAGQPRQGDRADRAGADDARRPRAGARRHKQDGRWDAAYAPQSTGDRARRLPAGARRATRPRRSSSRRSRAQSATLPVPASRRQAARDPRAADQRVRRDARRRTRRSTETAAAAYDRAEPNREPHLATLVAGCPRAARRSSRPGSRAVTTDRSPSRRRSRSAVGIVSAAWIESASSWMSNGLTDSANSPSSSWAPVFSRQNRHAGALVHHRPLLGDEVHAVEHRVDDQHVVVLVGGDRLLEVVAQLQLDRHPVRRPVAVVDHGHDRLDPLQVLRVLGHVGPRRHQLGDERDPLAELRVLLQEHDRTR